MNGLTRVLQDLGSGRFLVVLGTAAAVIGVLVYLGTRLTEPPMSLLYGDLEPSDSSKIVAKLETMGVPYELRAGGSQILVPSDKALRLRMAMAEQSLPRGGSVGYEVFDQSDTLGTTRTMQNINLLRALEGELSRTIRSLSPVATARVHLVMPKRELFSRERREPSASIVLEMEGGARPNRTHVAAIQHLVAAAVPELKPMRVSVVDSRGTLLARGTDEAGEASLASLAAQDYRATLERRYKRMIEGLLEQSVGLGNVRAEVNAEIDFDRVTTNAEIYDPDGQVIRSTQVVEEETSSREPRPPKDLSVANNLPQAQAEQPPAPAAVDTSERVEETTNYEISKTLREHVSESGTVKRLSVAVLVDGSYTTGPNGERQYQPRSDEEMERLATLVRSAIGYDAERGDTVEVINMAFAPVETLQAGEPPLIDLAKADYFKIAEMVVLFVVGVLIIMLVLRPLVAQMFSPSAREAGSQPSQEALPGREEPAQLTDGSHKRQVDNEDEAMLDIDRVEGKVKQSTVKKMGEIVESHPDEALSIIRNWLYQQA